MRRFLLVAAAVFFCAGQAFGQRTNAPLNLEQMARRKFLNPPLSEAEERVLLHASDGTGAECANLGGGIDPAKADGTPDAPDRKWPNTRNVRADLIRWLIVDREARGHVDPNGIWIKGARITGALNLNTTDVPFPLGLVNCRLEQDFNLQWAKMAAFGLWGTWTRAIKADGLKLESTLFLVGNFHADEVRLVGSTIGGDLEAVGDTFKHLKSDKNLDPTKRRALSADRIKVAGSVFLGRGFSAEGEVRLLSATIGDNFDARGGTFENSNGEALNADRIEVKGDVLLADGFSAEGSVRLSGAEIGGQLAVASAWLDKLDLFDARVTGPFFWQDIQKETNSRFPHKKWKPYLNLTAATVGPLADQEDSWPEKGYLSLDGFVYNRIATGGPTDARARLKWLRLQIPPDDSDYRVQPQPYEQLIAVLRQMGHEDQAAEVAIGEQKDLYAYGGLGWTDKFWSWFLYLVVGYGYEPWLAFLWIAILVVLGTFVFSLARLPSVRVMVPSEKDAYESDEKKEKAPLPGYYPQFHAFVYSLDVILPFDLGQKSRWRLHERRPRDFLYWLFVSYSLFQLFIGWALLLVAAAVPAGLIK